jgi:transposase-like protein
MKRIGPAKSNSDLTELYKDIQKGLKEGRRLAAICRELGITPQDVYSYRAKLKRGKELISATEPRTAPAIVRPRAKEVAA